ncbi:MAG: MATE family efflux transporter [Clostridia bacterium]|nr:MATE family efflux transporter [Clostridia bacterium]
MAKYTSEDYTEGRLLPKMLAFALPLMAINILQSLYQSADLAVVGRFGASSAVSVAAIGATGSIINAIINFFGGLSVGAGVVAAQAKGARDDKELFETVHTAIPLSLICGVFITVFCLLAAKLILAWTGTPDDIIDLSALYLRIYFAGAPAFLVSGLGGSLLRAVGDYKRPLFISACAGGANVALNVLFVVAFRMDVAGVAVATLISSYASAAAIVLTLMKREDTARLFIGRMKIYGAALKKMLKIGVPAGIQGFLHSFSNVIIQSSINSFGKLAIAGNAAAVRIEALLWVVHNAFTVAGVNFTAQNFGARKFDRIKKTALSCIGCIVAESALFFIVTNLFGSELLGIFIKDSPEAVKWGLIRLAAVTSLYVLDGVNDCANGLLRGLGYATVPMVSVIFFICIFRIGWVYTVFAAHRTYETLMLCLPVSWALGTVFGLTAFILVFKRLKKKSALQN